MAYSSSGGSNKSDGELQSTEPDGGWNANKIPVECKRDVLRFDFNSNISITFASNWMKIDREFTEN